MAVHLLMEWFMGYYMLVYVDEAEINDIRKETICKLYFR